MVWLIVAGCVYTFLGVAQLAMYVKYQDTQLGIRFAILGAICILNTCIFIQGLRCINGT